ncbi:hypothetical protein FRB94_012969 [Tulasnella sp. JGI-2019a]|nr:hypothetical protein FRB94_012969 [Tulasnella sp. JGI-2019a]
MSSKSMRNNSVPSSPPDSSHRHSQIHSQNFSIFFPRPENGSPDGKDAIAEDDDGHEIAISSTMNHANNGNRNGVSDVLISTRGSGDAGTQVGLQMDLSVGRASSGLNKPKRHGHHHKHSLSHNILSMMDLMSFIITPQNWTPQSRSPE